MPRFLTQSQFDATITSVPCRKPQAALLDALLCARPPALLAYGPAASGKSSLIRKILDTSNAVYAWVDCDQCNTARIMLQRAIRGLKKRICEDLDKTSRNGNLYQTYESMEGGQVEDADMSVVDVEQITASKGLAGLRQRLPTTIVHGNTSFDVVTENISAFYSTLQLVLETSSFPQESKPLILVLDRIDQMNDNPSDMYSCLTRVRELAPEIKALTTIFITSTLEPKQLVITHIPHIRFTPYTTNETIEILEHWGNTEREKFLEEKRARQKQSGNENNDEEGYGANGQLLAEYKKMVLSDVLGLPNKTRDTDTNMITSDDTNEKTDDAVVDNTSLYQTHLCVFPQRFIQNDDPTGIKQTRFWQKYVAMIVHALNSYTGSDIRLLKEICLRVWPAFINPVITGGHNMSEFQALWRECKYIFQTEIAVQDELIYKSLDPLDPTNLKNGGGRDTQDTNIDPVLAVENGTTGRGAAGDLNTQMAAGEANRGIILSPRKKQQPTSIVDTEAAPSMMTLANKQLFGNNESQKDAQDLDTDPNANVASSQAAPLRNPHRRQILPLKPVHRETNELPLQSKYILIAAYLASYNPPRFDIRFFSRAKDARAKRRDTGRRKLLKINPRLLAAPAFDMERMLAILHAIAPAAGPIQEGSVENGLPSEINDVAQNSVSLINKFQPWNRGNSSTSFSRHQANPLDTFSASAAASATRNPYADQNGGFPSNIDIGVQIATLTTLRLIVCLNPNDPLDSRTRWKINASWPLISKLAGEIGLDLKSYLIE